MKVKEATIKYRYLETDAPTNIMDSPRAIVDYMKGAFDKYPEQESFWIIPLNRKNRVVGGRIMLTLGTATASLVNIPQILKTVLLTPNAVAFCCIHNHPSGDCSPSQADIRVTRQLRESSKIIQLDFLDHVIIGEKEFDSYGQGFYSFAESGLL
jgi:DNA repair protein RadC